MHHQILRSTRFTFKVLREKVESESQKVENHFWWFTCGGGRSVGKEWTVFFDQNCDGWANHDFHRPYRDHCLKPARKRFGLGVSSWFQTRIDPSPPDSPEETENPWQKSYISLISQNFFEILTGPFPCKMGGCGAAEFSFIIAAANGKILGSSPAVWKGRHLGILLCDLITPPDIKGWLAPRAKMAKKMSILGIFNILPGVHDAHWQNWGLAQKRPTA